MLYILLLVNLTYTYAYLHVCDLLSSREVLRDDNNKVVGQKRINIINNIIRYAAVLNIKYCFFLRSVQSFVNDRILLLLLIFFYG